VLAYILVEYVVVEKLTPIISEILDAAYAIPCCVVDKYPILLIRSGIVDVVMWIFPTLSACSGVKNTYSLYTALFPGIIGIV